MTPTTEQVKEAEKDFEKYTSGTGKTMHDLAQLYLTISELPEDKSCEGQEVSMLDCVRCESCNTNSFNEALSLVRIVVCKEEAENKRLRECLQYMIRTFDVESPRGTKGWEACNLAKSALKEEG